MKLLKGPRALVKTGRLGTANATRMATYLIALWKLFKHPQTPRAAKWVAVAVLAYAVSPIDLIPDFIPVLGLLDDVVLIPLGIALVVRLTPRAQWEARLHEAEASTEKLPRLWWAAALIALVWALLIGLFIWWLVLLATA
jgi:uncharacterized membrane protein YkvA (DUF1232 family)